MCTFNCHSPQKAQRHHQHSRRPAPLMNIRRYCYFQQLTPLVEGVSLYQSKFMLIFPLWCSIRQPNFEHVYLNNIDWLKRWNLMVDLHANSDKAIRAPWEGQSSAWRPKELLCDNRPAESTQLVSIPVGNIWTSNVWTQHLETHGLPLLHTM